MSPASYDMLVNRSHRLASDWHPPALTYASFPFDAPPRDPKCLLEPQTADAAKRLFAESRRAGLHLTGVSGYRSYERQQTLYAKALDKRYVAPPGASEHQTGLALDVSCPALDCDLTDAFAFTPEGIWLAENAAFYGFILRYPREKEKITGYAWEPWHIRYVTRSLALYLKLADLTLEEYALHPATAPSAAP